VWLIAALLLVGIAVLGYHRAFGKAKTLLNFPWGEHPIAPDKDFDL